MKCLETFGIALKMLKGDKLAIALSLFPIIIGGAIFYFSAYFIFGAIDDHMLAEFGPSVVKWGKALFLILLGIAFNFSFIFVVSLVATPFNDILSSRVEKKMEEKEDKSRINFASSCLRGLKRFAFLAMAGLVIGLLGFFPILAPLVIVLSGLMLSANFLDYSWGRHDFSLKQCFGDIRNNFLDYGLAGLIFFFAMSIPLMGIFLLPYGVVYYTVLFIKREREKASSLTTS